MNRALNVQALARSQTPGEFLSCLINSGGLKLSLGQVARQCKIASRGYLSDVLNGNKKPSVELGRKISRGFKLGISLTKFLDTLILSQISADNEHFIELERQRSKLLARQRTITMSRPNDDKLVEHRTVFQVYASLGEQDVGASLSEIRSRSGLSLQDAKKALALLKSAGYVQVHGDRFKAIENAVDFKGVQFSPDFAKAFSEESSHVAKSAKELLRTPDALCFYGAFSIASKKQLEFKERLRELLYEFMNEAETSAGDRVVKMTCTFY